MARLVINDLKEDKALDESAMKAVAGGSGYGRSARRGMSVSAMGTPGALKESRLVRGLLKTPAISDAER